MSDYKPIAPECLLAQAEELSKRTEGLMKQPKTPTPARLSALLAVARVHIDPVCERGQVCRGAYIVDTTGCFYLTNRGTWTHGIQGDDNWWHDKMAAENYLLTLKSSNDGTQRPGGAEATG